MTDYRLYLLDEMGRIRRAVALEAMDDPRAIAAASGMAGRGPAELWQRQRKVQVFEPAR